MANSTARAVIDVGSVIADTYVIEALLGRGGMGAVFLASHRRLAGKRVAIKILHTEIDDADILARFKREAEIAARLNHPNIVGVIDYNVAPDGTPYLVLDYLEGETLAQRIARGPMPIDQVLSIVRQVGSALAAAHRADIVHRDLKPQNIFLVATEVDGRHVEIAKVLDFGISKIRGSQTVKTQDSALLGTPQYMAPEQATGQHASVDERTDVFALGAIVYEMLCGQPAFSGASIPEVVFKVVYEQPAPLAQQVPSLPPAIANAVAQAMAKPAEQRFPSVAGFVEAVTGQPLTMTRPQPAAPAPTADSPSAARRVASGEAFARTMGSGDFGDSPVDPRLATAAPGTAGTSSAPPAPPGSSDVPQGPTPNIATTGSTSSAALETPPRSERAARRSVGAIAALVIAAAAVAGGAVYLATRSSNHDRGHVASESSRGGHKRTSASETRPGDGTAGDTHAAGTHAGDTRAGDVKTIGSAADSTAGASTAGDSTGSGSVGDGKAGGPKPGDAKPGDAKPGDAKPGDAKPGDAKPGDAKPGGAKGSGKLPPRTGSGAKPTDTHGTGSRPPKPESDDDVEGDEGIRVKLQQAAAALDRREYDQAERIANSVINSPATPRQHATARMLHGIVQCAAHNDQEAAGIDLRSLDRFRALRARLLNVCRSHGIFTVR